MAKHRAIWIFFIYTSLCLPTYQYNVAKIYLKRRQFVWFFRKFNDCLTNLTSFLFLKINIWQIVTYLDIVKTKTPLVLYFWCTTIVFFCYAVRIHLLFYKNKTKKLYINDFYVTKWVVYFFIHKYQLYWINVFFLSYLNKKNEIFIPMVYIAVG